MKTLSNKVLVTSFINAAPNDYYLIRDELLRRLEELDNLKCCGNCKFSTTRGDCREKGGYLACHYCEGWESDGLKRNDREDK
jgi:hypothetical protein